MRVAALLLVAAVVTGCGGGGDQVSDDHGVARLEQQRDDVRGLATDLTASLAPPPSRGVATRAAARRSTTSTATSATSPSCASTPSPPSRWTGPRRVGLTRDDAASEPDKLRATRDDLSASFWSLPAGGLLVTVQGPCVDVPEDARSDWTRRGSRESLA